MNWDSTALFYGALFGGSISTTVVFVRWLIDRREKQEADKLASGELPDIFGCNAIASWLRVVKSLEAWNATVWKHGQKDPDLVWHMARRYNRHLLSAVSKEAQIVRRPYLSGFWFGLTAGLLFGAFIGVICVDWIVVRGLP